MFNKSCVSKVGKPLGLLLLIGSLTACQLRSSGEQDDQPISHKTLQASRLISADLKPVEIKQSKVAGADLISLRNAYAELAPHVKNHATKLQMDKRLASLEMFLAEQKQVIGEPAESGYFKKAIVAYQALLQQDDVGVEGEHIRYQLSRALELQGDTQGSFDALQRLIEAYPKSQYLAQAHFRQGEFLYAQGKFTQAAKAYTQAVAFPASDYYAISAYMLGWSEFKLQRNYPAVLAFGQVLDKYLGRHAPTDTALPTPENLSAGEQRLVNDSVRIMSLVFSYGNNEQSLLAYNDKVGARHYDHILFDGLAQLQLNNDRYKDSALVYLAFAQRYFAHPQAAEFYVKHIDAYILGKYPSLVMPAKQGYVEMFGVNGDIWSNKTEAVKQLIRPYLRQYLEQLSQYEHARGQLLVNTPASNTKQQHIAAFTLAARWYQEYITTFSEEVDTVEKRFLLAESLEGAGQQLAAITEFERYAYQTPQGKKTAEAAYAGILLYSSMIAQAAQNTPDYPLIVAASLASQSRFINTFPGDERANSIALNLLQTRFANKEYSQAIEVANGLLLRPLDSKVKLSASLVAAHSLFATAQFVAAESAYGQVLMQLNKNDKRYLDMEERLGVSIYRQAEQAQTEKKYTQAITLWQRIVTELPNSEVRLNAQYDAATLLLAQKNWSQAIALLTEFSALFPTHTLTANIPEKLIYAYEQSEQWQAAADALYVQWQNETDQAQDSARLALWTAAQYYQKANLRDKSLPAYRQYAHRYPAPFDTAMEARFIMSEFYLQSKEQSKRRFWLNKIIQADKTAGKERTVRSQYLAAMSSWVFAEDVGYVYNKIKLTLPLKNSLNKKRKAMDIALAKLDLVMAYGVAEFSTAANFKIAEIFRTLSVDLMDSERPKGLSALELNQYEILLEEQAYPFEDQAIALHESNVQRSWAGNYDKWVQNSINQLSDLLPVRYGKDERVGELADEL
ncbi:MAG: TolA-binding protein [Paraglaciecola sp.]|jgi:TolA-binding protein